MNDFFKNLPCSKDKDFVMVPMCSTANRRVKRKVSKGLIIVELAILCLFLGLAAAAAAALARYLKHRKRRKKEVRMEKRLRTQDVEKEEILRRDMFANTTNGENQERSSHQTRQQDRSTKSYTIGTNSSRSEDVSVFSVNSSYDGQETNTIDDKNVPSEPAKWQQSSTDKDCSKKDVVLKTETHDNETVYDDKIVQKTEMISRVTKDIFGQREEDTKKVEQRTVAETTESEKSDKEKTAAREIENQITDKTDEMNKDGDEKDKLSEQQTIGTTTVIKTSNASLVSILLAASEKSTDNKSEELKTESKAKRKISTSSPKQKTDEKDDSKNKSSQIESPPKAKEDDILKTDILKSDVKMNQPTKPGKSGEESSSLRKKAFDKPEKGPKLRRTSAEEQAAQKEIVAKVLRKTESPSSSSLHENTSITLPNIHID